MLWYCPTVTLLKTWNYESHCHPLKDMELWYWVGRKTALLVNASISSCELLMCRDDLIEASLQDNTMIYFRVFP